MIHGMPYNAEAPPEALVGDLTPNALHYVRSNFAVPTHDGTLEIGGAVGTPTTLTLEDLRALPVHDQAVTLECAGNGRLGMKPLPTGEPWGDYAVSTARWTGAMLHDVLALAQPSADGVDVRFEGADHGAYHLNPVLPETSRDDLTFVRALPLAHVSDPGADILDSVRADLNFGSIFEHWLRRRLDEGRSPADPMDWPPSRHPSPSPPSRPGHARSHRSPCAWAEQADPRPCRVARPCDLP
jgi:hypothetical protein